MNEILAYVRRAKCAMLRSRAGMIHTHNGTVSERKLTTFLRDNGIIVKTVAALSHDDYRVLCAAVRH